MDPTDQPPAAPMPERFKPTCILVHYNEIALKGENRRYFEETLVKAIRLALDPLGIRSIRRLFGRIRVDLPAASAWPAIEERLRHVYGISHFEAASEAPLDIAAIENAIGEAVTGMQVRSFGVFTRRANKLFPLDSVEINRRVGKHVVERTGWKVSLDEPELPIFLYILEKNACFAIGKSRGPGGLPIGVAGKVVCLLSGGIDSPVAASRMMRRGCVPCFVHFHSAPFTSAKSIEKVKELASHLMRLRRSTRLYLIPFAELQQRLVAETPAPLRVILYRRFMMRTAAAVARKVRAKALVTGENLGQVASQTIENIATIEDAAGMPVLRPLLGFDKLEIIREAEQLGTFAISIQPHDDCCSFLMPRHPATRSTPRELREAEARFDVEAEVEKLIASAEIVQVGPPLAASEAPAALPGAASHPAPPPPPHPSGCRLPAAEAAPPLAAPDEAAG